MNRRALRFGLPLPMIGFFAVVTLVPCGAQENHSGVSAATAEHAPAQPAAANAAGAAHEESGASVPRSPDTDAIDARIAPPSHAAHERAAHARPVGVSSPRNLLARPHPLVGAATPTLRNSIGVAIQHGSADTAPHGSVLPLNFGRRAPSAAVKPVSINNGALSGTGLAHHTLAPAAIGGAAPVVGGINGSSIRPKHTARP